MAYDAAPVSHDPAEAVAKFHDALHQTAQSNRVLLEDMTAHAKDETLRFWNLRLERTGQALDRMQDAHGISGLINAQHEWMRDLVQDYADHSLRTFSLMRGWAQETASSASAVAQTSADRASDAVRQANDEMQDFAAHAEVAAEDADGHLTQH